MVAAPSSISDHFDSLFHVLRRARRIEPEKQQQTSSRRSDVAHIETENLSSRRRETPTSMVPAIELANHAEKRPRRPSWRGLRCPSDGGQKEDRKVLTTSILTGVFVSSEKTIPGKVGQSLSPILAILRSSGLVSLKNVVKHQPEATASNIRLPNFYLKKCRVTIATQSQSCLFDIQKGLS